MSYNLIASTDQYAKTVEIYEWNGTADLSLYIKDIITIQGGASLDKYATHLPYEVQLPVIDISNQFINLIRNRNFNDFKLVLKDTASGDTLYEGFINTRFSGHKYARTSNVLMLSAFDGISILKSKPVTYTENDRIPLGDLLEAIIHETGITLDIIISTTIEHTGQSSPSGIVPNGYRVNPMAFVRDKKDPKLYDLLMAILSYFKFQLFQEDGAWHIVERDIRSAGTFTDYNITADTSSSSDKTVTITRSDQVVDPEEDAIDPVRYEREVFLGENGFEWKNETFEEWSRDRTDNRIDLLYWIVNDQSKISGDFGGAKFTDSGAVVLQKPFAPIKGGTTFNFKFLAEFRWKAGLDPSSEPDNTYRVEIAEIIAYNVTTGAKYTLNPLNLTWNSGGSDTISDQFVSTTYDQDVSFDYEGTTTELPAGDYNIMMRLYCEGDTAQLDELPRFIHCELTPASVQVSLLRKVTTYTPSEGEVLSDSISASETHKYLYWSDFEYYDGTDWLQTSAWGTEDTLDDLIGGRVSASSLTRDHVTSMNLFRNFIKMINTIDHTIDEEQRDYVPIEIKYSEREKIQRVKLIQSKLETIGNLQVRYLS